MKRILALVLAIVAAGLVTATGAATATQQSGALHITKECSQYDGTAGSFCTITSSNIDAIKPGMRVVYLQAVADGQLDSDIVLSFTHGRSVAVGRVLLDLTTAHGRVTIAGGTGNFSGFHAHAIVSVDPSGVWHWDGSYSFRGGGDA